MSLNQAAKQSGWQGDTAVIRLSASPTDEEGPTIRALFGAMFSYGYLTRCLISETGGDVDAFDAFFDRQLKMLRNLAPSKRHLIQRNDHFTDPLLARIANYRLPQSPLADPSAISEQQIGLALLRGIEVERPGMFADFTSVMYARTSTKKEIDFVGPALGHLGVEGKDVDDKWKQERLTVKAQFGRGILATRSILDLSDDVWAVPAGMLAWLLSE